MDLFRIPYSIEGLFKWVELEFKQARLLSYAAVTEAFFPAKEKQAHEQKLPA